jgi:hypothetical protein
MQANHMDANSPQSAGKSRSDKDAARALECDDDPDRFRERLGKLVKHKPVETPE